MANNIGQLTFSIGKRRSNAAGLMCFQETQNSILRTTKEYSFIYVPETNEWFGDVIAYGQWWDLEADEVLQLREAYNLDELMRDYLGRGDGQQVTYDSYAAAK